MLCIVCIGLFRGTGPPSPLVASGVREIPAVLQSGESGAFLPGASPAARRSRDLGPVTSPVVVRGSSAVHGAAGVEERAGDIDLTRPGSSISAHRQPRRGGRPPTGDVSGVSTARGLDGPVGRETVDNGICLP